MPMLIYFDLCGFNFMERNLEGKKIPLLFFLENCSSLWKKTTYGYVVDTVIYTCKCHISC